MVCQLQAGNLDYGVAVTPCPDQWPDSRDKWCWPCFSAASTVVPLQPEATDLLALTADYPVEHPLRQAAARLTARLALAEGKIATATAVLERAAVSSELSVIGLRTDQALEILRR